MLVRGINAHYTLILLLPQKMEYTEYICQFHNHETHQGLLLAVLDSHSCI